MSAEKKQSRQTEKRKYRKCLPKKSNQGRQKRGNTENVCWEKAVKADRKEEIQKMSAGKKQIRQTKKRKYRKCLPEKRLVKAGKQGGYNGIRL